MKTKTGRKQKQYVNSATGLPVVGLSRRPSDGRWRIIGTQTTYTEPDEQIAIRKFYNLTGGADPVDLMPSGETRIAWNAGSDQRAMIALFRDWLTTRPQWLAEQTGVEWLAYGPALLPPTPLPTFEELQKLWTDLATTQSNEKRKVLADWLFFVKHSGAKTLTDITPESAIAYRNKVYKMGYGGKRQSHLFGRARRMLTFAISQAVAMDACGKALQCLKLLKPNDTAVSIDPDPIDPGDFKTLLDTAVGDDRAFLLLMLNCALHTQEAVNLEWGDIKGDCLIAHRKKKGKFLRIATLWLETLDALKNVKRRGDRIFYSVVGQPITIDGMSMRFRKLRAKAGLPKIVSDQIRDGAATAVGEANVNDQLFNLLLGHRNPGMKDNYAKRNPQMVRPACDAVHRKYFTLIAS